MVNLIPPTKAPKAATTAIALFTPPVCGNLLFPFPLFPLPLLALLPLFPPLSGFTGSVGLFSSSSGVGTVSSTLLESTALILSK